MGTSIRNETTKESSEIQRSNKADRIPTVPTDGIVLKTGPKSGPWPGEKNVPPVIRFLKTRKMKHCICINK